MALPFFSAELNERQVTAMSRRLERFAGAMADPTPANREASIALYGWTIRNFDRQGGLQGGWAALAARTIREKQRIGKQTPLVRTGHLRSGFTSFYSRDNAGVGNEVTYAKPQHFGAPARNLPARELLPRRGVVLQIGLKVYGQYLQRKTREANGSP